MQPTPSDRLALPAPRPDAMMAALEAVLDRIEAVVAAETEALASRMPVDVGAATAQKRKGLLELSRLTRALPSPGPTGPARQRLERLALALDRNQAALEAQIGAVREVADIVAKVLRDAESDGTYTLRSGWQ